MIYLIIFLIVLVILLFKYYKLKYDTIIAFTGGLGSGKSHLSVKLSLKLLRRQRRKVCLLNFKNTLKCFFKKNKIKKIDVPLLYSSIPVMVKMSSLKFNCKNYTHYVLTRIGYEIYGIEYSLYVPKSIKVEKKYIKYYVEMSAQLTDDHILLQRRLNEKCVVFIDEIGSYCSQFEFNHPNAKKGFDEFIRLFRHYTKGGYMVVNDQCSENIVLYVRRRLNTVFNLMNFRRKLLFFYTVQCRNINISEEIKTVVNDGNTEDSMRYLFGVLLSRKKYDTYCYSVRYDSVPYSDDVFYRYLKKHELLRISNVLKEPKTK